MDEDENIHRASASRTDVKNVNLVQAMMESDEITQDSGMLCCKAVYFIECLRTNQ